MIRSNNHSSYPRVGESPLDQQIRAAHAGFERGELSADEVATVEDEVATLLVAEQSRAFVDIVTDGMVRWSGPLSPLARQLEGLETRGLRRWFDTNLHDRRVAVVGPIRRVRPFLLHGYQVAQEVAKNPVKSVLPGPVTFARMCIDEHYGSLEQVALALCAALVEEVRGLAAAGARIFQLDEPMLCRQPGDLDLVCRTAGAVFDAAGAGATTILSTYYGDLVALGKGLDRLPGTHIGLDLVGGPANFDLLARLSAGKGVALGLFEARTTRLEDAGDVARRLEPHRAELTSRDVLVGPNAGLELLPKDVAFDKLLHSRYLVESLGREWTWAS